MAILKAINMYKVYLVKRRKGGSEIIKETSTKTPSFEAAKLAFLELRKQSQYEGQNIILLMTKDKAKLNKHLFNVPKGDEAFFELDSLFAGSPS